MRTNYQRGTEKEREVKRGLEALGYTCTRSASSQGLWDVVGVSGIDVVLVQSKLTQQKGYSEDENCAQFRALVVAPNVRKELWIYRAGQGLTEVFDLKRPKPAARSPAAADAKTEAQRRAGHIRQALRLVTP